MAPQSPLSAEARDEKVHINGEHPDTNTCSTKPRIHINRTHVGVWDIYEEIDDNVPRFPPVSLWARYGAAVECAPYVIRLANDLLNIPGCAVHVMAYAATEVLQGLVPVVSIWLQGQLLSAIQIAIDAGNVDKFHFVLVCTGLLLCNTASVVLIRIQRRIQVPLNARIRRWYSLHSFGARARLDLPTYAKTTVRRLLDDASDDLWGKTVPWQAVELATSIVSAIVQFITSVAVLFRVLSGQQDGEVLVALTLFSEMVHWLPQFSGFLPQRIWMATTSNEDYLRMCGWENAVQDLTYRQELVAGGLARYATAEFEKAAERVGELDTDWREVEEQVMRHRSNWVVLTGPLKELPQMYFTFRSAQYASSSGVPVPFASLNLIQNATHRLGFTVYEIIQRTKSIGNQLESIRKLYESINIENAVPDGTVPFPEETADLKSGIELEFQNVSFKYPDTEQWALRNISFKLLPGQLCVIVGENGAGKSTILKLTTRLYDPQEGEILFGGHDIRTLKLDDIRHCMSVLFQDYNIFPLSIRDNIALGAPTAAHHSSVETSECNVEQAARLAGAESFIEKLPKGLDTYLNRPVPDVYSRATEGTKLSNGRSVSYQSLRMTAGVHKTAGLSGGQIQRLAVARTLLRSVVKDEGTVGLMLFDEPSASLDPEAEYDLFSRLRELRGSKTMLFSSHRFGHLTGYADLILFMDGMRIAESGTHAELMLRSGEYARLWNLQAQAFA